MSAAKTLSFADRAEILKLADACADNKDDFGFSFYNASLVRFAIAISKMCADQPCPTCESLALAVMMDQTGVA